MKELLAIIEDTVQQLAATGRWRVHPMGALDLLPDRTATAMLSAPPFRSCVTPPRGPGPR